MSKKQPRLTGWFPPEVKPVRKGIYLATVNRYEVFYRHWDGANWFTGGRTPTSAAIEYTQRQCTSWQHASIHWRGLAEQPK